MFLTLVNGICTAYFQTGGFGEALCDIIFQIASLAHSLVVDIFNGIADFIVVHLKCRAVGIQAKDSPGIRAGNDVKIKFTNCTAEDHAKIYRLVRPYDDELIGMFVPFGRIAPEYGQKILSETVILDARTNVPILSIQPFTHDGYEHAVKVRTMNVADHDDLQRMVGYQIRKFNACRKCLKCESLCRAGAISIIGDYYYINPAKCVHCKMCVTPKYLDGGCMMNKYLKTK